MKRKLVLWGSDAKDEKILVALELVDDQNVVNVYTFDKEVATEEFYNDMLNKWREDADLEFPMHQKLERPLTISDSILPEDIKVERADLVTRAQTEWHFVVLSSKLYQMYKSEVEDLNDTIEKLTDFDNAVWTDLRNFWGKVQEQVYEKNLFRDHAASLKNKTNKLFDQLKVMKKEADKKYDEVSAKHKEIIVTELASIEERIEKGQALKPIFEELKKLQSRMKNMDFSKKHRRQLWDKVDATFKIVKEKRFGDKPATAQSGNSPVDRLQRRMGGLQDAIGKMQNSIKRDKEDQQWQAKRVDTTNGQLEMQIRQAKIKMIDERIKSKQEKLDDMLKTKTELESKIARETEKAAKRAEAAEVAKAKAEAAEVAKAKIAAEIAAKSEETADMSDQLEKAATQISDAKKPKKAIPPVELPTSEEPEEEAAEPATAATADAQPKAEAEEAEEAKESREKTAEEEVAEAIAEAKEKAEEIREKATDFLSAISVTVGEALEDVIDTVKAVAEVVEDKIEDTIEKYQSEEE